MVEICRFVCQRFVPGYDDDVINDDEEDNGGEGYCCRLEFDDDEIEIDDERFEV